MINFTDPGLQENEGLKGFEAPDDLGKAYLDLSGKVSGGSIDLLPEELRKDPTIANYKTLTDLSKGFIETKKLVGTIKRAPAKPEDYKLSAVEGLHPSVKISESMQKEFPAEAHKAGIPNDQVDALFKWQLNYANRAAQAAEKAKAERAAQNETALRQEWGENYDGNMKAVETLLMNAGGEELVKELAANMKNTPMTLKALAKVASLMSPDSIKNLGGSSTADAGGDAEYNEYAAAIAENDPKHPISNERHPDHVKAVNRWTALNQMKHNKAAS